MSEQNGLEFSVAKTVDEVISAWRLVHDKYTASEIIAPNPFGIHTNPSAVQPSSWVISGKLRGKTVSTLTVMHDSEKGLPLDSVYPEELSRLRQVGRPILEVGLLADRREKLERYITALYRLFSYAWFNAKYTNRTLVCGVHPHHANFYVGSFGFEQYGVSTSYPKMNDVPVVLLRMNIEETLERNPLPKATKTYLKNPLPPEVFEQQFNFSETDVAGTELDGYLKLRFSRRVSSV